MARPGFVAYLFVVQCTTAVLCRCFYIRFVLPLIETWCEGKHPIYYVALIPEGYDCDREYHFMTTNDEWFWASPYAE